MLPAVATPVCETVEGAEAGIAELRTFGSADCQTSEHVTTTRAEATSGSKTHRPARRRLEELKSMTPTLSHGCVRDQ